MDLKSVSNVLTPRSFFNVTLRVLFQFCCCFRQSMVKKKEIINLERFFLKSENRSEKNEDENFRLFFWWFVPKKIYHMNPLPSGTNKMCMGSSYAKYPGEYNGVKTLKNITAKAITCNKSGSIIEHKFMYINSW